MSTLKEIVWRLEAATGADRELDAEIWLVVESRIVPLWPHWDVDDREMMTPRYTASLDAAMTLVPVYTDEDGEHPYDYIIEHTNGGLTIAARVGQQSDPSFGDTAPLAICIASLKARDHA